MIVHGHQLRPPYVEGETMEDYGKKRGESRADWINRAGTRRRKADLRLCDELESQDLSLLTGRQSAEARPHHLRRPPRTHIDLTKGKRRA